jgi:hypothetical protein
MVHKFIQITLLILIIQTNSYAEKNALSRTTVPFCSNQILAHKIQGGYTWTLASRMGELILKAEQKFGSRDKTWTLLGTEFRAKGSPQVWYPHSGKNARFIAIQLTKEAAGDKKKALFQLAHEVIHTLSPAGPGKKSSVLEEGMATYFSIHALTDIGVRITPSYISSNAYKKAYALVVKLYNKHPDTEQRIKKLRRQGYTFSNIPYTVLMQYFPHIDSTHARLLTKRFDTFRQR